MKKSELIRLSEQISLPIWQQILQSFFALERGQWLTS